MAGMIRRGSGETEYQRSTARRLDKYDPPGYENYPYPIPDDPEEIERQLQILLRRKDNLARISRLWPLLLATEILAVFALIGLAGNLWATSPWDWFLLLTLALLIGSFILYMWKSSNWRKILPYVGLPENAQLSDFLFRHLGYTRSDTQIVEEQISAFSAKPEVLRGRKGDP